MYFIIKLLWYLSLFFNLPLIIIFYLILITEKIIVSLFILEIYYDISKRV